MGAALVLRGRRKGGYGFQIDFMASAMETVGSPILFALVGMFLKEARRKDSVLTACKGRETTT
jgi:hypothetical protein